MFVSIPRLLRIACQQVLEQATKSVCKSFDFRVGNTASEAWSSSTVWMKRNQKAGAQLLTRPLPLELPLLLLCPLPLGLGWASWAFRASWASSVPCWGRALVCNAHCIAVAPLFVLLICVFHFLQACMSRK